MNEQDLLKALEVENLKKENMQRISEYVLSEVNIKFVANNAENKDIKTISKVDKSKDELTKDFDELEPDFDAEDEVFFEEDDFELTPEDDDGIEAEDGIKNIS